MKKNSKIVLITGGGKGIGRATAFLYAKHHHHVIITGRNAKPLIDTTEEIISLGGKASHFVCDVTNVEDVKRLLDYVRSEFGRLDVLINNAGMSMRGEFKETDLAVYTKMMDINFHGTVNMTKIALPLLLESKGSILIISSLTALKGLPYVGPYSSAKMALTAFSESIRAELRKDDVHVGIIYVGLTETESGKLIYDKDGNLVPLPKRKNSATREEVASSIYRAFLRRKKVMYLTPLGKFINVFYRLFPRLSNWIITKYMTNESKF